MRRTRFLPPLLLSLGVTASALVGGEGDAKACGGCFHDEPPPGSTQSPSVVTDHRMAIALSPTMTTLWDQVEYAGDPADFAWVLPVRGSVVVGLGSDEFLTSLDTQTAPAINSPRKYCSRNYSGCGGGQSGAGCGGSADSAEDIEPGYQEDSGVFVTGRSVVGPYATVTVHGDDEGAIVGWLRAHKYVVPTDIEPILKKYVEEKFDFVAVRLRPGAGVHAMRPIRVSWKGATPSLPLRMVAAGVGSKVGIKLFVIGDGRWKTKNFPTFAIDPASLTWDFAAQRSDYTKLRDQAAAAFFGRAFAVEASLDILASSIPYIPPPTEPPPDPDTGVTDTGVDTGIDAPADSAIAVDAPEVGDAGETSIDDAGETSVDDAVADASDVLEDTAPEAVADATDSAKPTYDAGPAPGVSPTATDLDIAFGSYARRRVTRLRADLGAAHLNVDLELEADLNQDPLSPVIQVQKSINGTNCPTAASVAGEDVERPLRATIGILIAAAATVIARRAARGRKA